jgi:uncharacterized protein YndB with AHSA1/START domain
MSPETQTVKSEKLIKASAAQIYLAFTNATLLKEWLCDVATVSPKPGGRMYLWWNGDFYSSGEYVDLEPNRSIIFQWFGRGESMPTQVEITLTKKKEATQVTMAHTLPAGEDWQKIAQGFQHEWSTSLENLASVLETGLDRRVFDRPMLGINVGDFSPEQARQLNIPVTQGLRLDYVGEGMGAHAAGLRRDDVLVSLGGTPLSDFDSLLVSLRGKRGGDKVEVVFYRGPEKMTVDMELTRRPVPEVPFDIPELARRVRARYDESLTELAEAFKGVTEAEASFRPAEDEWSAKEVLGHLLLGEQFFPNYYANLFQGQEMWSDAFTGNSNELTRAAVSAYPSVPELLEELRRLSNLMVAFIEAWPKEYLERKGAYFRAAWQLLEGQTHTHAHLAQIQDAIAKSRKQGATPA